MIVKTGLIKTFLIKNNIMEKIKMIVNHPMAKCVIAAVIGGVLLVEGKPMYAGIAFGYGIRELFLAFKNA